MDTQDTVPDRIDEDCDGKIDEDATVSRANCPPGMHIIEGTHGDDVLYGTRGRDCILGYGGNDTIYGQGGSDLIFAGAGDDRVYAGSGTAFVYGGPGNDLIDTSQTFASFAFGEAGQDTLIGGPGADLFYGGGDNDVLNGGGGNDVLNGGACHDLLLAGAGFDFGDAGPDFDACDSEFSFACELSGTSRVSCANDAACGASERCAVHSGFCVPRTAALCGASSCVATSSLDTSCDGVDDDCDGKIDEDYDPYATVCGAGSCMSHGVSSCVNGVEQDNCTAAAPMPGDDANCDGLDDDCDGKVDEGFVSQPTSCGVGVCARSGSTLCQGGQVVDSCQPGTPAEDSDVVCNGLDDDCDGSTDEDFIPEATSCGTGACAAQGVTSCVAGAQRDSCQPGAPLAASDSTCDGVDDDCNGVVDDGYVGHATSCGFGQCARTGATSCSAGKEVDSCHVDCEGQCTDGIDDDSDGLVDCADPDCANAVGCLQGSFGSPCSSNAECDRVGGGGLCITGIAAGYCSRACSSMAPCPTGTFCWANTACVVACGPNDHCGRQDFVCSTVSFPGMSSDSFCHADCSLSCPLGKTCDPETYRCN